MPARPDHTDPDPSAGFSLSNRIDIAKDSQRYGLSRNDIKRAIADVEADRAVESAQVQLTITKRKSEYGDYLHELYNEMARGWKFDDMAHMMARAHTEIVARAIAQPETFAGEGLKALKEIARLVFPMQKATVTRSLPPGDTKEDVLQRLKSHFT